ncbi:MAG: DUF6512 family protein [Eubacteriales bacterium]|nr:DUF6512 family protein [Eubacteriales bacterium]
MSKKLFKNEIIGFVFVSVSGTLCHFIYEWSDYSRIAAMFSPVNESTWEHLKLLFFPYMIWTVIQYIVSRNKKGIIFSKAVGLLFGLILIVSFYYTYTGVIGKSIDFLNVLSFFIGTFGAFLVDYVMIRSEKFSSVAFDCIGIGVFVTMTILFFLFTIAPPFIPLFKDPQNLSYGI